MTSAQETIALPERGVPAAVTQHTSAPTTVTGAIQLRQGPVWRSWEQFRLGGSQGLHEQLPEGSVGRLRTKRGDFACLRWNDFDRIYALAQDVNRLSQGVLLMQQAAEVVLNSENLDLGVQMIRNLSLQYQLPAVATTPLPPLDIEVEADEEVESQDLADFAPPRPQWK